MGFMDRYKNLTNGNGNGGAHPPQAAPVPPVVQRDHTETQQLEQGSAAAATPTADNAAEWNARQAARAAEEAAVEARRQAKLNADFPPAPAEPVPAPGQILATDAPPTDTYPTEADVKAAKAGTETGDSEDAAPAADAPKKRGRPKKTAPETVMNEARDNPDPGNFASAYPKTPAETTGEAVAAVQAAQQPPRTAAGAPMVQRPAFTLLIDVMLAKGAGGVEPVDLSDWWAPIETEMNEQVLKEKNLPSYWLLQFAEQKAVLAAAVQAKISAGLPPAMFVSSSNGIAREVLPMLMPHATQVYRAVRG